MLHSFLLIVFCLCIAAGSNRMFANQISKIITTCDCETMVSGINMLKPLACANYASHLDFAVEIPCFICFGNHVSMCMIVYVYLICMRIPTLPTYLPT